MLELRGAPALSAFRHERLLTVLRDRVPEVEALSAHYVHFIDHHEELDHAAEARLAKLLEYGSRDSQEIPDNAQRFLVVPRLGTQCGPLKQPTLPTTAGLARSAALNAALITA